MLLSAQSAARFVCCLASSSQACWCPPCSKNSPPPPGPSDDPDQTDLKTALLFNPGSNQLTHSLQQRAVYSQAVSVSAGKAFLGFLADTV